MKIAVLRERKAGELRVAATPDAVKKYARLGANVTVETGGGAGAAILDEDYEAAGATIVSDAAAALSDASIILKVLPPEKSELMIMPEGAKLVGMLEPYARRDLLAACNLKKLSAFALELLPRISRAQGMDVLSSQANLAGYRAVIEAAAAFGKVVPMMMTAAGTVAPAKALVLGAGVAGLQAIATARRLGAVVSAFDVRPAVKEQAESLGAKFIEVAAEESGEAAGGYAKEMSEDYKRKQSELIHHTIKKQDMVITTALIPGKRAPVLITEAMVEDMKPGSVIVDLAAASGGNCPLTELDKMVVKHGVTLIGYSNLPGRVAIDASQLYARNLCNFVSTLLLPETKWDDELVQGTLLTRDGATVHKGFV
ncbi:MAG: Re/Si-specific NAD(P)(+) transhydrogenase subunit alpha [Pseudomonadota bacterium]|nr:Re/Si-specific NAD(P)(+) transhydrogenase subunit alpha [Pseudomonadota bacterium]MDE3038880.1 Re/Si-specific NAD(P)(+) transhydrogenase subunit alpha [Pseudomonadota bacterium]